MPNNKLINWLIFIALCFIWGSSFILMKVSKEGLSASQIASLRIFSAGLVFLPFAFNHITEIARKKIPLVILSGVFGNLLPAFLFAAAIAHNTDSSLAGILNSLTPFCVAVIGILFFKSKIKTSKIVGIAVGFIGLCLLFFSKGIDLRASGYAALVLLATVFYGINVNIVSYHMQDVSPVHAATVSLSFMTIPTAFVLWQQGFLDLSFYEPAVKWSVITAVLLGIAGSAFATLLFYILVRRAGGLFASLVTYGIPFIAIFWGFMFGETVTLVQIACLGIILGGVFITSRY